MGLKQRMHLRLLGLVVATLVAGCAHTSVQTSQPGSNDPVPSQYRQIFLASADESPLNLNDRVYSQNDSADREFDELDDEFKEDELKMTDPLVLWNRAMFHFNDRLYFWFLKPVATGYKAVVPQLIRIGVRNFFDNLSFPIRFVNCLLQAKFEGAGNELVSFLLNTTVGVAGLYDVATKNIKIKRENEDFGQTLGSYGIGPGFFINWPILGPSSLRDTVGFIGDFFLDPLNYMVPRTKYRLSVKGYHSINQTSLTIGDYEDLKKSALDPYISYRDAYFQYRENKIKE